MPAMNFAVLGPLEVTRDGTRIPLGGPKQRLVLAHLLVRANEVVSADRLIDEVWGDEPPDAARPSLHSYVSHLRKAVGPERLESNPPGYILRVADDEIDAKVFELLVAQARRRLSADPVAATRTIRQAQTLWRGEPLADLSTELSLQPEIERLSEIRLAAQEDLIDAELILGRHAELVPELDRLVGRYPLRERLSGQLMLALYRSGRQADALTVYHRLRKALDEELGLDPSPALETLQRQILSQDPALELHGEPLRGYRVVGQIASGPLGVVQRAFDPHTEREVAIKVFGDRIANDAGFVRRFDADAARVARLEHPNIVPLLDWWREPNAAYVVMRLMTGGSLADRVHRDKITTTIALHWGEQVGSALAAAHRQGVVHGDVRPGNVLFDAEDNAYLADFSLGTDLVAREGGRDGADPYLAPERATGSPASTEADIYAFARLLAELLGPSAGADLATILAPAFSVAAADRPASVADLVAAARRAALAPSDGGSVGDRIGGPPRNPYKGLRAFEEADAGDFVGREALVSELVARMSEAGGSRLLAVVGASGSGKSSVVEAGLLPSLRLGGVPGSDRWFVASMTPGHRPFEQLERALLGVAVDAPASLAELVQDESGLGSALERVLPERSELLLVIDQFEELFTLSEANERRRFLDLLGAMLDDPSSRVRLVITLRADFYDRPLRHDRFGRHLAAGTHAVAAMTPEELGRAVAEPAERAGLRLEQGLVTRIVAETSEQPGALPLLQYALSELWERRDGSRLSLAGYDATGGIAGAVSRRAEHLVRRLDGEGREQARQLFLRLVEPGEGAADTARRVRISELAATGTDVALMNDVIEAFARYRLLLVDRDPDSREPTVELAHEALLRAWPRLQQWVDEARDDLRSNGRLTAAASQWIEGGRDPSFLLAGSRLEQAEGWIRSTTLAVRPDVRAFVTASVAERRRQEGEEERRMAHQALLERRALLRLRALVAVLGAGALLAGVLSVYALRESDRAAGAARIATARELAAAAAANLDVDPQRSILLALASQAATAVDDTILPEAVQALHDGLASDRLLLVLQHPSTANVEWSPDGRLLATGGTAAGKEQTDVLLWDAADGTLLRTLSGHTQDIEELAFSPDSSRLVTNSQDGQMIVWDTTTGEALLKLPVGLVTGANFSPDGRRLVLGGTLLTQTAAQILDANTGEILRTLATPGQVGLPTYSPDGTEIAVPLGDSVAFYDAETGAERRAFPIGGSVALFYSPDGARVSTVGERGIEVFDAHSGELQLTLAGSPIGSDWSADGTRIATGDNDGTARIWDARTGEELLRLAGHSGGVALVSFSPDGTRLATGGTDGTARVWDITPAGTAELLGDHESAGGASVAFSPDGKFLVTGGWCSGWMWDTATRSRIQGFPSGCGPVALGPRGQTIARLDCADQNCDVGMVDVIDTATGEARSVIDRIDGFPGSVAVSPDGRMIATAGEHPSLWDAASGEAIITQIGTPGEGMHEVAFSADGRLVAGITDRSTLYLWDIGTRQKLLQMQAQGGFGAAVAFSPDGSRLATGGGDGATVRSLSGDLLAAMTGAGRLESIAFDPAGTRLATGGSDGTARIWDAATGEQLVVLKGHEGLVTDVAFSPDGNTLATVGEDGSLRVYTLEIDELVAIARARVTRGLEDAECRAYLHLQACPAPSPQPSGDQPVFPTASGAEGAYRVSVAPGDLTGPLVGAAEDFVGDYTLSLVAGHWRLHLTRASAGDDSGQEWTGAYAVTEGRITLRLEAGDPACFGTELSGRWTQEGESAISFAEMTFPATGSCGPQDRNDAWLRTIFEARPWARVP